MRSSGVSRWGPKMMNSDSKKTLREAEEFQPDAIMLEAQRPPFPMHIVWFIVVALLFLMIIWASFAKVDKIVTADGKLTTIRPTITMKPYERTVIKTVNIRPGQRVREGQVLFTFDPTITESDYGKLLEQRQSLNAHKMRLEAELAGYGKPFVLPANPDQDMKNQHGIFEARKLYYQEKVRSYDENLIRYQKTLKALEESLKRYEERKEALGKIEKMMSDLRKKNIVSLKDLLETQISFIEMAIQIDQQNVQIVENRQQIHTIQAEKNAFIKDWNRQIMEEHVNVKRELISVNKDIPKAAMLDRQSELRSPCDAVVHELAPFQEGSAVREAEALVTLIPINVPLEAEVDIPAKDIGWVKLGDKARVKLDAFPFQQCGTLDGEVIYISQDAFNKGIQSAEQMENTDDGGKQSKTAMGTTYQARLKLSGELEGRGKDATLLAGMRLKAEIKVGKRTIINYILNPFVKALSEGMREP